jgi:hypothetical protein
VALLPTAGSRAFRLAPKICRGSASACCCGKLSSRSETVVGPSFFEPEDPAAGGDVGGCSYGRCLTWRFECGAVKTSLLPKRCGRCSLGGFPRGNDRREYRSRGGECCIRYCL